MGMGYPFPPVDGSGEGLTEKMDFSLEIACFGAF